ncbi:MAG TPA: transporter substrate-binding domain-containing protein [Burkholderiaceae bacterium]|jgi:polar amino acid transport system substrate-binding protein
MKAWVCGLVLWGSVFGAVADELRVAVDASTEMPWTLASGNQLIGGLHYDLGVALANALGLHPRFLLLPRKRLTEALVRGEADVACSLLPAWLPGPFDWTSNFLKQTDVVLTLRSAPAPASLKDLAGQAIGTVNGFGYVELDRVLGRDFVRDDAPSATANMNKLVIGRVKHAIVNDRVFDYQRRHGFVTVPLHPPLVVHHDELGCAVSRRGHVTVAAMEPAIRALQASGKLRRVMAREY